MGVMMSEKLWGLLVSAILREPPAIVRCRGCERDVYTEMAHHYVEAVGTKEYPDFITWFHCRDRAEKAFYRRRGEGGDRKMSLSTGHEPLPPSISREKIKKPSGRPLKK